MKSLPPVIVTFNPPPSREVLKALVEALAIAAAEEDHEREQQARMSMK